MNSNGVGRNRTIKRVERRNTTGSVGKNPETKKLLLTMYIEFSFPCCLSSLVSRLPGSSALRAWAKYAIKISKIAE
jgi:hypothetical protein